MTLIHRGLKLEKSLIFSGRADSHQNWTSPSRAMAEISFAKNTKCEKHACTKGTTPPVEHFEGGGMCQRYLEDSWE